MNYKIPFDPSEARSNSLFPTLTHSYPCLGMEALTGCDFAVTTLPLPITKNTLSAHIKNGALFVQRKSGYDFIGDFEQVFREIARIQECGIPRDQAFILTIGQFYPGDDGLLRLKGKKQPFGKTTYKTFLALQCDYESCGVIVSRINSEDEIQTWIDARLDQRQRIKDRQNTKVLYPTTKTKLIEPNNGGVFQTVTEILPNDMRYFLNSGLKGFGQILADTLMEYAKDKDVDAWGFHLIKLLTDEDEKGKPIHNIPGWGNTGRKKFRLLLGLPLGYNLSASHFEDREPVTVFRQGWKMALDIFRDKMEKKNIPPQQAWEQTYAFDWEW